MKTVLPENFWTLDLQGNLSDTLTIPEDKSPVRFYGYFGSAPEMEERGELAVDVAPAGTQAAMKYDLVSMWAVPFGDVSQDWRRVSFAPGAFTEELQKLEEGKLANIPVQAGHMSHPYIGTIGNTAVPAGKPGAVEIWQEMEGSQAGLHVSVLLSNKSWAAKEARVHLEEGTAAGVSIGFIAYEYDMVYGENDELLMFLITRGGFFEISVVSSPALPRASAGYQRAKDGKRMGGASMDTKIKVDDMTTHENRTHNFCGHCGNDLRSENKIVIPEEITEELEKETENMASEEPEIVNPFAAAMKASKEVRR